MLGGIYTMDMVAADLYTVDRVHTVLLKIYGGVYPITEILANV